MEDIGRHYVRTLTLWREALLNQSEQVMALGFDAAFLKEELGKAECEKVTEDCLTGCAGCGLACGRNDRPGAGEIRELGQTAKSGVPGGAVGPGPN